MIVVDSSVLVALLLRDGLAQDVESTLADAATVLLAPDIVDAEVLSALRRAGLSGRVEDRRLGEAVGDLRSISVERWPTEPMIERIWELRHRVTSYDAAYVVLAESLQCPLLTRDRRLARTPGLRAAVTLV